MPTPTARNHKLRGVSIVVADPDPHVGRVLADMLRNLGFGKVIHVDTGAKALELVKMQQADILITEWALPKMDGIDLVSYLRRSDISPNHSLPIIMVTARAERQDVEQARDAGVTEFVVKPFTTRKVFSRIEEIVDKPRGTIFCPTYVGPNRRRRASDDSQPNRRTIMPVMLLPGASVETDYYTPRMMAPDFTLKRKIGDASSLGLLITDEVLSAAQSAIDTLQDESMSWVQEDLRALEYIFNTGGHDASQVDAMKELLLAIKSRAGTFGYHAASSVAQLAYRFLREVYQYSDACHVTILLKHIQALKVVLAGQALGQGVVNGSELLEGLKQLSSKYLK